MATDSGVLSATGDMFKSGTVSFFTSSWAWVLWTVVGFAIFVVIAGLAIMISKKKKQWTHKLEYRRELASGYLSKPMYIRMRRCPLIKRAEIFQLETPLLGSWLIPELDSYTDGNTYSIVVALNNRIYKNTGERFDKDNSCVLVSAKHAEIDLARSELTAKYQDINKTSKRVEWSKIVGLALAVLLIIAVMIIAIKGIGAWSDAQDSKILQVNAEAASWQTIQEVMENMESTVNANILLADKIKDLYGTNNLQGVIREARNES